MAETGGLEHGFDPDAAWNAGTPADVVPKNCRQMKLEAALQLSENALATN